MYIISHRIKCKLNHDNDASPFCYDGVSMWSIYIGPYIFGLGSRLYEHASSVVSMKFKRDAMKKRCACMYLMIPMIDKAEMPFVSDAIYYYRQ